MDLKNSMIFNFFHDFFNFLIIFLERQMDNNGDQQQQPENPPAPNPDDDSEIIKNNNNEQITSTTTASKQKSDTNFGMTQRPRVINTPPSRLVTATFTKKSIKFPTKANNVNPQNQQNSQMNSNNNQQQFNNNNQNQNPPPNQPTSLKWKYPTNQQQRSHQNMVMERNGAAAVTTGFKFVGR
jgi:hypothetical protein